jgi:hypothetical protein
MDIVAPVKELLPAKLSGMVLSPTVAKLKLLPLE